MLVSFVLLLESRPQQLARTEMSSAVFHIQGSVVMESGILIESEY